MFKIGDKVRFTKAAEKRLPFLGEHFGKPLKVVDAGRPDNCAWVFGVPWRINIHYLEPYPDPEPPVRCWHRSWALSLATSTTKGR
jgi:hypothetical protein